MPDQTDQTTQTDETSPTIELSAPTAHIVDRMVDSLGLWQTRIEAALFLASLALAKAKGPVATAEIEAPDGEPEALATVAEIREAVDEERQLALLGIVRAPEEDLETVLAEDLAGLIEAGAGLLGPRLKRKDAAQATGELVELVQEIG